MTTNTTTTYPDAPAGPIILEAPADAESKLGQAIIQLEDLRMKLATAADQKNYAEVRRLTSELPNVQYRIFALSQTVENGNLNVDQLVEAEFPDDYGWFSKAHISSKLKDFDERLTERKYQHPTWKYSIVSAVGIVFLRMVEDGKLRKHGGSPDMFRRAKPGEKKG